MHGGISAHSERLSLYYLFMERDGTFEAVIRVLNCRRLRTRMRRNQIAWWLWAGGTVLIVLSWLEVVSPTVGWIGFGIGFVGSVISWGVRPPRAESAQDCEDR